MPYGYIGSMRVREGHRDEVIAMLSVANGLRAADCQLYAVCTARGQPRVAFGFTIAAGMISRIDLIAGTSWPWLQPRR